MAGGGPPVLRFDHLDRDDGLSQVSVVGAVQDRQGFVWIATQDGLNRFDGETIEVFVNDPDDPASLGDNLLGGLMLDSRGSLWLPGFAPGVLSRYDTYTERFETLRHDPDDPATLLNASINQLLEDGQGHVWAGTGGGGVQRIDPDSLEVTRLPPDPTVPGALGTGVINSLAIDAEGRLWVATPGGLHRTTTPLDAEDVRFRRYPSTVYTGQADSPLVEGFEGPGHGQINGIFADSRGNVWIGTAVGLARHRDDDRFDLWRHRPGDPGSFPPATGAFGFIEQPGDGGERPPRLWISTGVGVVRLALEAPEPLGERPLVTYAGARHRPALLPQAGISAAFVDHEGVLWIGTQGGGLLRYHAEDDVFDAYQHDPLDPKSLASDLVLNLSQSRDGTLWVGTSGKGIDRYSPPKHKFTLVRQRPGESDGLTNGMIFSLHVDSRGTLWVGTQEGGLHRYDHHHRRVVERYAFFPDDPDRNLGTHWVRALLEDSQGRFWVGTAGAGLVLLDRDAGRVAASWRQGTAPGLSNDFVLDLFEDSRGILWVSTAFGWNAFDPETETFTTWGPGNTPAELPNPFVRLTFEDREERLWVGTAGGLAHFDRDSGRFEVFRHDPSDPHSLGNDNVQDIYQDDAGQLWIATYGGGLNRFDPAAGRFEVFTRRDGLPSDVVYGMLPDHEGQLWLSTNYGLTRFDPASHSFDCYTADDGLQDNEFNGRAFFRAPDGELFFGGVGGFNRFYPERLERSSHVPPVVLTAFYRLDRRQRFDKALDQLDSVTVTHRDNLVAFEFATLDYALPEKTRYRYRLEGFDDDWIDAGNRRRAAYTNLDGGHYVFHVQGASGDGVWNEEGARLTLIVIPPPWKTWWAYLLYSLAGVGAILASARYYRREIENRRRRRELDHARRIQLSLLPEAPPDTGRHEIAVYMRTATEVGGDYYDFFPQGDGSLYAVAGDATGHGLSAGMMVSMTKSALKALPVEAPDALLSNLNQVVRAVNPERLNMALAVAHLGDGEIAYSSAAMPPAVIYRAAERKAEELLLPGLPLGGLARSRYQLRRFHQAPGDVLVMASDGLVDRLCADGCDGYAIIARTVEDNGHHGAHHILSALLDLGGTGDATELEDDVTILVIRRL